LAMRARSMVDGVLEHTGYRTVVFGRNEQNALGALDFIFQPFDRLGGASFTIALASLRLNESVRRLPTTTAI
jgi:hypothetical protein